MAITRIGIITCSNVTQEWGCVSGMCLTELRERKGFFEDYPYDEELVLAGIINCSGCPSVGGTQKILRRVRPLAELQVDAIHLSTCVTAICPFKQKYEQVIEEAYPEIKVVAGTHAGNMKILQDSVKNFFSVDLKDLYIRHLKCKAQQ